MSGTWTILLSLVACAEVLLAQAPALEPVRRAELAFARVADERGIRAAFLAWLTEEARVFTPRMVTAKAQYGPEPGDPGHLAWYPEAMGLAASGDLAWSLGPWSYAVKKGGPAIVNGHFLSIWRRQADGGWKVVADIGVPHGAPDRTIGPLAPVDAASAVPPSERGGTQATLRQKESVLSSTWRRQGGRALLPELAREACLLRPKRMPLRDGAEIRKALEAEGPGSRWEPAELQAATSGDLAWTCGETGPDEQGTRASFLRVWTLQDGGWKVLFDVRLPHPPDPK